MFSIFICAINENIVITKLQIDVVVGGLEGTGAVKCSRDVSILPDVALSSIDKDSFDVIVSSYY